MPAWSEPSPGPEARRIHGFRAWLNAQRDQSPRILNPSLNRAGEFLSWLEPSEPLTRHPLRSVQRIERDGKSSYQRRALTDGEARRLLSVPSPGEDDRPIDLKPSSTTA